MLHICVASHYCGQVGCYLFLGLRGASLAFLELLHKAFDAAIHKGE
jgi:hypothetical protein